MTQITTEIGQLLVAKLDAQEALENAMIDAFGIKAKEHYNKIIDYANQFGDNYDRRVAKTWQYTQAQYDLALASVKADNKYETTLNAWQAKHC